MAQHNGGTAQVTATPANPSTTRRVAQNGRHATSHRDPGEERRLATLRSAHDSAAKHLTRFGQMPVRYKGNERSRWTQEAQAAAARLLGLYFYSTDATAIKAQEQQMEDRVVAEVRRRFTTACYLNPAVQETAGQERPWFAKVLAATQRFHTRRKAARTAERSGIPAQMATETAEALATT